MGRFCISCGNELPEGAVFCTRCGKQVEMKYNAPSTDDTVLFSSEAPMQPENHDSETELFQSGQSAQSNDAQNDNDQTDYFRQSDDVASASQSGQGFQQNQSSQVNQTNTAQTKHAGKNYHSLGGWLLFFVIVNFFMAINATRIFFVEISSLYADFLFIIYYLLLILEIVAHIIYPIKIFKRSADSLRFFQIWGIIDIVCGIIIMIAFVSKYPYFSSYFVGGFLPGIIASIAGLIIHTEYYKHSVRVRTYYGSEAYMRNAIFGKNAVLPDPVE